MRTPVSLLPPQPGWMLPPPTVNGMSDDEAFMCVGLANKLTFQTNAMRVRNHYYEGTQRLQDLGVAVPQQLASIRTIVDWPRICVDPLVERCVVDGFRQPGQTDVDAELADYWDANDLDAEAPLVFLDALVYGRGYMIVGAGDAAGDPPLISVESPLSMTMTWDPRTRATTAAYQSYQVEGVYRAVLYLPDVTISMSRDTQHAAWSVDSRDTHGFGEVPVVRFANRQRASDREGRSEISSAIMTTTDSACRTLLGMEIAREFYSIPHRYILGANEADFQDAQGLPKTAIEMSMNKFLALERDEHGNLPTVGQFVAFDPSVYTKIIDTHAQMMSSFTGYPPQYFGLATTANPASADAIRVAHDGLNRRGSQVQKQFSRPLTRLQGLVWRFAHDGAELPSDMRRLETDWVDVVTSTPAATADAIAKQIAAGSIPATSDVTLKHLGYSAVERQRLADDRAVDASANLEAEIATSLAVKEAKANKGVIADLALTEDPTKTPPAMPPMPSDMTP